MNYDYNLTTCGRMAEQLVELKFQTGTATAVYRTKVFGNTRGAAVIHHAVENVKRFLGGDDGEIMLKSPDGESVECGLWDFDLHEFVVEAKIIMINPISFEEMVAHALSVSRIESDAESVSVQNHDVMDITTKTVRTP